MLLYTTSVWLRRTGSTLALKEETDWYLNKGERPTENVTNSVKDTNLRNMASTHGSNISFLIDTVWDNKDSWIYTHVHVLRKLALFLCMHYLLSRRKASTEIAALLLGENRTESRCVNVCNLAPIKSMKRGIPTGTMFNSGENAQNSYLWTRELSRVRLAGLFCRLDARFV